MSQPKGTSKSSNSDGLKLTVPTVTYAQTLRRLQVIQNHLSLPRQGRLKDKVCIITGVGSLKGIGRATALLFAHQGAKALYLLDFDGTNLPNLKETIEKSYPDVHVAVIEGDAADDATISNLVSRALSEQGRLDVFFANAGVASGKPSITAISDDEWDQMMHINTTSCFLAVKYAAPAMMKTSLEGGTPKEDSNGSILLTASVAGLRSGAGPIHCKSSRF
ncbi:12789_t:CDS:2 [Acaulospora colombiana]|uniref:12789_t:CDS:1 n=1 Tax=Acaulospora colombiana TaxID=27376 RepID=A0ACA9P0L0_9GLOM|nr:12789_t:CDS:2 [Acaulospora colombiana]